LIAHLTGKLIQKQPNSVIIYVGAGEGGVGYELTVPLSTFYDLGEVGAETSLRVYTYVREDALQLYGFRTEREKKLFLMLTSVSGIGPKLAITILSVSADELISAIRTNDLGRLVMIPGVGKKTAERLVVELRDKIARLSSPELEEQLSAGAVAGDTAAVLRDDLISALVNLGYQRAAAERAVISALKENPDVNFKTALKNSLRKLAR
jgi:Holliday junction DNA helicase RuvA